MKALLLSIIALFIIVPSPAMGETKTITSIGEYVMGDGETPLVAEQRAMLKAKRSAIEQAGVWIESLTVIKGEELDTDEIRTLASGITETEVLESRRSIVGNSFNFYVKIRATVTVDGLKDKIKRLKSLDYASDYKDLKGEHENLLKEMQQLKAQMASASKMESKKAIAQQISGNESRFQSSYLFESGLDKYFMRQYKEAAETFAEAIEKNPLNKQALLYLARSHKEMKSESAGQYYQKFLNTFETDNIEARKYLLGDDINKAWKTHDYKRRAELELELIKLLGTDEGVVYGHVRMQNGSPLPDYLTTSIGVKDSIFFYGGSAWDAKGVLFTTMPSGSNTLYVHNANYEETPMKLNVKRGKALNFGTYTLKKVDISKLKKIKVSVRVKKKDKSDHSGIPVYLETPGKFWKGVTDSRGYVTIEVPELKADRTWILYTGPDGQSNGYKGYASTNLWPRLPKGKSSVDLGTHILAPKKKITIIT